MGHGPFAVAQEAAVLSGKLINAAVNSSGLLVRRLASTWRGSGDNLIITVSGQLRNEDEPRSAEVRLGNVRTNNPLWERLPEQMLHYAGVRVWARRHFPEVMLGIYSEEEFNAPASEGRFSTDSTNGEQSNWLRNDTVSQIDVPVVGGPHDGPHDPETGEVSIDHEAWEAELWSWETRLATAAEQGTRALEETWLSIPRGKKIQETLKAALERRHKPRAQEVDKKVTQ